MLTSDAPPWVTNGSGIPVIGMIPMHHPDVDDELEQDHRGEPGREQRPERVARPPAGHEDPPEQEHEQDEQRRSPPMKPSSSARVANTKSVAWTGRKSPWVCVPFVRPLPTQPARPDRDLRLVELVARALDVGVGVEERRAAAAFW